MSDSQTTSTAGLHWPAPLPDFDDPPVVETVMAVHFDTARPLDSLKINEFWRHALMPLGYSEATEQDQYAVPKEVFGSPSRQGIRMDVFQGSPGKRYWFRNSSDEDLVQLQSDWIALNWRKASDGQPYRHYAYARERFEQLFRLFEEYCQNSEIGRPRALQSEMSYINHVESAGSATEILPSTLRCFTVRPLGSHLPEPEAENYSARYVAHRTSDGAPFGRLTVDAQPVLAGEDRQPVLQLNLTFRGRPESLELGSALETHDFAHDWIVGAFDEITTDAMHTLWGRKERDV